MTQVVSCVWTTNEENLLKQLAGKATVNKISSLMGRSRQSIRSKATKLGLSLNFKRTQWQDDILQQIIDLRNQGKDWVAIGKQLKKSPMSCQRAYSRHICEQRKSAIEKYESVIQRLSSVLDKIDIQDEKKTQIVSEFRKEIENGVKNEIL